jgi:hypothetical protein
MARKQKNPDALAHASGFPVSADFNASTANHTRYSRTAKAARVIFQGEEGAICMTLKGRALWALRELIRVGAQGLTSIESPAPRLAAYIFKLRARGLIISTIREQHGGEYPGHHARYVLRTPVAVGGGA